jgi:hypothetical protein
MAWALGSSKIKWKKKWALARFHSRSGRKKFSGSINWVFFLYSLLSDQWRLCRKICFQIKSSNIRNKSIPFVIAFVLHLMSQITLFFLAELMLAMDVARWALACSTTGTSSFTFLVLGQATSFLGALYLSSGTWAANLNEIAIGFGDSRGSYPKL